MVMRMDKKTAQHLTKEQAEALLEVMEKLSTDLLELSENLEQAASEIEDEEAKKFQQEACKVIEKIKSRAKA